MELLAGHGYSIVLSAIMNSGELDFGLYESDGVTEIVGSDDTRIADGEIGIAEKTVARSGIYYLRVFQYGTVVTEGSYDLAIYNAWFNAGVSDGGRNFWGTAYTSRYIADGTYTADVLDEDQYEESFRFVAEHGTDVEFQVISHATGRLNFAVYSSDGRELASSDDSQIVDGETGTVTLSGAYLYTGVYYLRVFDAYHYGYSYPVGTYDLTVVGAVPEADTDGDSLPDAAEYYHGTAVTEVDTDGDEVSDYDELQAGANPTVVTEYASEAVASAVDMGNALALPVLDEKVHAEYTGTETWYSVELLAGHGYSIVLSAIMNSGELDFGLYESDGVTEIVGSDDTRIADGEIGIAEKTVARSGIYYLRVFQYGTVVTEGSYDLAIYNAWFNAGVSDGGRNFWGTAYTSRYIADGTYTADVLDEDQYEESFRFVAEHGTDVEFQVISHATGRLNFAVYSSDGRELASSDDSQIVDGETGTVTLSGAYLYTGVYYLRVFDAYHYGYSYPVGTYDLTVVGAVPEADTDGDSLPDAAEYYHGTAVTEVDTDGDEVSDYDELQAGANPTVVTEYASEAVASAVDMGNALALPVLDEKVHAEYTGTETWYSVELLAGHGYSIVLSAIMNSGELDFGLYESDGVTEIVGSDDTRIADGEIGIAEKTVARSGIYYLRVFQYGTVVTEGSYDLAIYNAWFNAGVSDGGRNFWGTAYTSRYIADGTYTADVLDEDQYEESFRFVAEHGTDVEFQVISHATGRLNFAVYSSDGRELASSDDSQIVDGETGTVTLSGAYLYTGVYYLRVFDAYHYGYSYPVGTYDLTVVGAVPEADTDGDSLPDAAEYYHGTAVTEVDTDGDEVSDYDELQAGANPTVVTEYASEAVASAVDMGNALALPVLDEKVHAEYTGTETWYSVELLAGHGYSIVLSAIMNSGELDFGLYESDGVTEIVGSDDTRIADGEIGIAEKTVARSGIYYLRVFQYGTVVTEGSYDLAIYNAWFNAGVSDGGRNFWGTAYTSRYIADGTYTADVLDEDQYEESFRFVAEHGTDVEFQVISHATGRLNFAVYSSDGRELASSDDSQIVDGETGTVTLSGAYLYTGVYYLRVFDAYHYGYSYPVGTYDLTVVGAVPEADTDGDSLPDAAEYYHGTAVTEVDTDGDEVSDYDELQAGANPTVVTEYASEAVASAVDMGNALALPVLDEKVHAEYTGTETWYSVELLAGHGYSIVLSAIMNSGELDFGLYESDGVTEIVGSDDTRIADGEIGIAEKTVARSGIYYLRVFQYGTVVTEGSYDLAIYNAWFNAGVSDGGRNFWGTAYTSRYIADGTYTADVLDEDQYEESFRFVAEHGTDVEFQVISHATGRLNFAVYSSDGRELASSDDSQIVDGETGTVTLSGAYLYTGVYYLRVFDAYHYGYSYPVGTYDLTVVGAVPEADTDGDSLPDAAEYYHGTAVTEVDTDGDEVSDYDELQAGANPTVVTEYASEAVASAVDMGNALALPVLDEKVHAEYTGTETWYSVELLAGHGYSIVLSAIMNSGELDFGLYESDGVTEIVGSDDTRIADGEIGIAEKTVARSGIYYLRVFQYGTVVTEGSYDLAIYNAWFNAGVSDGGRNFWGTAYTSRYIADGTYTADVLDEDQYEESFRFVAEHGTDVEFQVISHATGRLNFAVYSSDGRELASSDDSQIVDGETGTVTLSGAYLYTGVYYLRVFDAYHYGYSYPVGTYDLTVVGAVPEADTDGDSLPDAAEYYHGTAVTEVDTDGDEVSDYDELQAGANPTVVTEYASEAVASAVDMGNALALPVLDEKVHAEYTGTETWYSVELLAGHGYSIVLSAIMNSGELDFGLYESDGVTEIVGSDDTRIADGEIGIAEKTVARSGIYYLRVFQYGTVVTEGSYDLAIYNAWFNAGVSDGGRNFWGTAYTSRYIADGTYTADVLDEDQYEESFRFVAEHGTDVEFQVISHATGRLNFAVYSSDGRELASSDDSQIVDGETGTVTLSGAYLYTGVYYLRVFDAYHYGYSYPVGTYDLTVVGAVPEADTDGDSLPDAAEYYHGTAVTEVDTDGDEVSDYDELQAGANPTVVTEYASEAVASAVDMGNALALPVLDEKVHAEYTGTETWYSVELLAGHGYSIVLSAIMNSGELDFGLYESDGVTEIVGSDDTRIADGEIGIAEKTVARSGIYYLRVFQYGTVVTEGSYDLAIYNAWFNAGVSDGGRNFWGTAYTSRYIADGTYTADVLDEDQYEESFRFVAEHGTDVEFQVISHATGRLNFAVYSSDGRELASSDDSQIVDGETGTVTLSGAYLYTGVYYLRVFDAYHYGYSYPVGTYDLTVVGAVPEADTDGDSLPDAAEYYHGTAVTEVDTDGDEVSDYDELQAGANPTVVTEYASEAVASAVDMGNALALPVLDEKVHAEYTGTETWYSVELLAGHGYSIVLSAIMNSGELDFGLYESDGVTEIVGSDDTRIADGEIGIAEKTVARSGIYYLRVFQYGTVVTEGSYDLAIYNAWFNAGVSDGGRNFWGTAYTSRYIADGTYTADVLDEDQYEESFRFVAEHGTDVEFQVISHATGRLNFAVYSSDGRELASSDDSQIVDGETGTVTLSGAYLYTGVYYLRVFDAYHYGYSYPVGTYDLTVVGAVPEADTDGDSLPDAAEYYHGTAVTEVDTDGDEVSDYDELQAGANPTVVTEYASEAVASAVDMGNALALPVLDEKVHAEYTGTETWYSVELLAGHGYSIVLSAIMNSGELDFGLYESDGVTEIVGSDDTRIADGEIGIAEKTVARSGIYYLRVFQYGTVVTEGSYDLAIYNAWFNAGVSDSQRDFYDTFYTARYISNGAVDLFRCANNYFRFYAEEGTQIDVSVVAYLNNGGLDFSIYDENYVEIDGSDDSTIQNGETGASSTSITQSGTYYFYVWQRDSAFGYYDLSISGHEPIPIIQIDPSSYDFGSVNTGEYASRDFTITNQGEFDLTVGAVTIDGNSDYTLLSDYCSQHVLSHLQTCNFRVRFTPTGGGEKHAIIQVPSNDLDRPILEIPLSALAIYSADDIDGDNMPNQWEEDHGLDPIDPSDAEGDLDNDDLNNIGEFENNTDPNNSDTDDDGVTDGDEVSHGSDPTAIDELSVAVQNKEVLVSLTGGNTIYVRVSNWFCKPRSVEFELSGLDSSWYSIDSEDQSFDLLPYGFKSVQVHLNLPSDCSITTGSHSFEVTARWQENGTEQTRSDQGTLLITPNPNIYKLAIPEDTRLAGNSILAAWKTDIPADSYLYYRKLGEQDYTQVPVAENAIEHRIAIPDLEWFAFYEFYTESHAACGGFTKAGPYQVRTGKAVKFADGINEFWIDRDYYQPVTLTVTNTDLIEHIFQMSVLNDNEDLVVEFVGDGSIGRQASIKPGESMDVELMLHAPDATKSDYDIYLKLESDAGEFDTFVDYAHAIVHVRPFVANLDLIPEASTPGMMTYTFTLMNYGDTLTDIEVYVDNDSRTKAWFEEEYHHLRLETGDSRQIVIHAQEYTTGILYVRSGNYVVSAPFEIGCPDGYSLNTYTLTDVPVLTHIRDWYCTNKQQLNLPFAIPRGFGNREIVSAFLEVEFSLPMALEKYDPHTVKLYINDHLLTELADTVPQGTYQVRIPTSFINTGLDTPTQNYLKVVADDINVGQYVVVTDFKIHLHVAQMTVDLCVPPPTHDIPPTPPEPETKIIDVGPNKKFRPGDSVEVFAKLYNNGDTAHQGTLTVTLTNNSVDAEVQQQVYVADVTVLGGEEVKVVFNTAANPVYTIPDDADDIDYSIHAEFQNQTMGQTAARDEINAIMVRRPLIIIHGFMGSELKETQNDETIWSVAGLGWSHCDNEMDYLACPYDSSSSLYPCALKPTHVIKKFVGLQLPGSSGWYWNNIFQWLETYLKASHYRFHANGAGGEQEFSLSQVPINPEAPEDVFYFVYDWTQDNVVTAQQLNSFVNTVLSGMQASEGTQCDKVNIAAHSMGGLVAKSAVYQNAELEDRIDKIIFVGTPNLGAVDIFSSLKYGLSAPLFGRSILVDHTELLNKAVQARKTLVEFAKNADPSLLSLLSKAIDGAETLLANGSPNYCNEYIEWAEVLINLAGLIVEKDVKGALADLLEYYNMDKDLNGMRDYQVMQNSRQIPSAYQLLPTQDFLQLQPEGYYAFNEKQINLNSDPSIVSEISALSNLAQNYWDNAVQFHSNISSVSLPEKAYAIVGCKKCTTMNIIESDSPQTLYFSPGDGDGTVPLFSAVENSVPDSDKIWTAKYVKHLTLPSNDGVRELIGKLLHGDENPSYWPNYVPKLNEDACGMPACEWGAKILIPTFKGKIPTIVIRDADTSIPPSIFGPNGISIGIVGSDFRVTNEGVEILIPEGSAYEIEIHGIDEEYLNFKVQLMREGGSIKTYVFTGIILDIDGCGKITFDLADVMTDPILRISSQCDGNYDSGEIAPSIILDENESDDLTPPITTADIIGTSGSNAWYTSGVTLSLNATDTGGSGLLATRYKFSNDANYVHYTGSIQISEAGTHTLTYYSIDRNLNQESAQSLTLKIDPEAPEVLSITDAGHFNLGLADMSATIEPSVGPSGLQEIQYSVGTSPGLVDVRDWTSGGTATDLTITGLSLVENCVDTIYINVRIVNGAGVTSEVVSSDGVIMLESGGDPDADGFINEAEVAAGSNPCNADSIPKDTTVTLKPGFNLFAIPAEVMFRPDLRDWLPLLGTADDIEKIMVYDLANHRFVTLIPEATNNPAFTLGGGEALIVYAKRAFDASFTSALCGPMDLRQGLNLVGFACPPNGYSAFDLLNALGVENMVSIQRFDTDSGTFETAGFNENQQPSGVDFSIAAGEGYFLAMKTMMDDFTF
ncbi:hypothetical protein DSCO28_53910 [Desulfosarcina ovata subsp. sediminis]|uniref:GPI inositol-deacylase PGAP1-like alpha/beta domain-containing protein n=1 Tax=Desulfosarcina ovata subsp. sediminis TaxID=885957 RepID=A0A5K7ZX32_9BACT|nr:choice-of-anchor D domain-containing protein [Desulfosarcina ovata]BBO84825.1 hypothetical protein DSCO28_53910 [Desulfosarcina ovata subsp. sediminis]